MLSPDRISYEASMGKSTRKPILAAGGIVIRDGSKPRVAIVQRRRDGAWVLPKGKLKPDERPIAAAKREASEETGYEVRVHEFLGVISYFGSGGPKIVHFWRMRAIRGPIYKLTVEIKSVEWLPLSTAIDRLTLSHERFFLRNVGRYAMRRAREGTHVTRPARGQKATQPLVSQGSPANPLDEAPRRGKPHSRWNILTRFSDRWQTTIGRTG